MSTTAFDKFREAYFEYIREYEEKARHLPQLFQLICYDTESSVVFKQKEIDDAGKKMSPFLEKSGLLARVLISQLHDSFSDENKRNVYLLSIKTFVLRELDYWSFHQKEKTVSKWQPERIYRDWMPDYLYDILFELKGIEKRTKFSPESSEKKAPKKIPLTEAQAVFCSIVRALKIIEQGKLYNYEYCAAVEKKFDLQFLTGVRNHYKEVIDESSLSKFYKDDNRRELIFSVILDEIIPQLPKEVQVLISNFISKHRKPIMYA